MKALSVAKLKKIIRDMEPGFLLVRRADNTVAAFTTIEHPITGFNSELFMLYWKKPKEPKKC